MHLVRRKKLNHRGAVASIVGIPLAILLTCTAQANAGSDTVNVRSSNQSGAITAYQRQHWHSRMVLTRSRTPKNCLNYS